MGQLYILLDEMGLDEMAINHNITDITLISMILCTFICTILGDNASSEGDNDIQTGSEKLQRKQKDNSTCKPQVKFTKRKNVTSTR